MPPVDAFPTLSTARLTLREFTAADAPALAALHRHAAVTRWLGAPPVGSAVEAAALIERYRHKRHAPSPTVRWAIVHRHSAAVIGSCSLFNWDRELCSCATGYALSHREWGHGYMQEALSAVLAWGFAHGALKHIEARVHPDNSASIRLVERLGFTLEATLRHPSFGLGRYLTVLQYGLRPHALAATASASPAASSVA